MSVAGGISRGFWSGVIATGPMTLALFLIHRLLPASDQKPLPPALLSRDISESNPVTDDLSYRQHENFMMLSHFGFGATTGALYGAIQSLPRLRNDRPFVSGLVYGSAVWSTSYLLGIELFGSRAAASRNSMKRNAMMLTAHFIWGWSVAYSERELRCRGRRLLT